MYRAFLPILLAAAGSCQQFFDIDHNHLKARDALIEARETYLDAWSHYEASLNAREEPQVYFYARAEPNHFLYAREELFDQQLVSNLIKKRGQTISKMKQAAKKKRNKKKKGKKGGKKGKDGGGAQESGGNAIHESGGGAIAEMGSQDSFQTASEGGSQ